MPYQLTQHNYCMGNAFKTAICLFFSSTHA